MQIEGWRKFEGSATVDLIEICQNGESTNKNDAFTVLVFRFREELLNLSEIRCRRFGHPPEVAEVIVENTFESYYRKGNFKESEGKGKNIEDSFVIYLAGIAKNALTDFHRKQKRIEAGLFYDGTEEIITELPKPPNGISDEAQLTYDVLMSLPYSHRVIYCTYKSYEKAGCNLPKPLRQQLRDHLGGIEQSTVRVYKKEAIDRIEQALSVLEYSKSKSK